MAQHTTDVKVKFITDNSQRMKLAVRDGVKKGLKDCVDDLIQVSSASAPKDTGKLEKSYKKRVIVGRDKGIGVVGYTAINENNNYEYSIWIHEGYYELGPISQGKTGGTSRISHKSFPVGRKFLENPLKEGEDAYIEYIKQILYGYIDNVR